MEFEVSQQHYFTTKYNTFWASDLIVISGRGQFNLKNIDLVNQVTILKNVYHFYNDKNIDYYYLHLEALTADIWRRISIGSNCITDIRIPNDIEIFMYKLEVEDIHGERKIQSRSNKWWDI